MSGSRPVRRDAHRPGSGVRERRASPHRGHGPDGAPDRGATSPARPRPRRTAQPGDRRPRSPRLQQPARGRRRLRILVAVLVLLAVGLLAWLLLLSPVLGVRDVEVTRAGELSAEQVVQAAAVPEGTPLLRLDTADVERRVEELPRVRDAEVSRTLTGTVEVVVTERTPVAVLREPDGVHLVDVSGADYATVEAPPAGLPELRVPAIGPPSAPREPAVVAAVEVLAALPPPLRAQVVVVAASSAIDVSMVLADGREVRWGAADKAERKAAVLGPLLTQPGQVYDVTTPELATIS